MNVPLAISASGEVDIRLNKNVGRAKKKTKALMPVNALLAQEPQATSPIAAEDQGEKRQGRVEDNLQGAAIIQTAQSATSDIESLL